MSNKSLSIILAVILLSACAKNTNAPASEFCQLYQPIFDHPKDTASTRDQVLERNAIYDCVCLGDCPAN